jgi:hypothetical protein
LERTIHYDIVYDYIFRFETPATGHLCNKKHEHICLHTPTSSFSAGAWKQALTAAAFQWLGVPPWAHDGSKSHHLLIFWIFRLLGFDSLLI